LRRAWVRAAPFEPAVLPVSEPVPQEQWQEPAGQVEQPVEELFEIV